MPHFDPELDFSITICSWNTQEDLRTCLQSLRDAKEEARFETIVVDNNSEDGSAEMVAREFPEVRLEAMAKNLGFTGGHNHAFGIRRSYHAMPLNSDTVVHPGALTILASYLHEHPEAGIIGPKLLNPDGSLQFSCRRFPNPLAALFRNTPLGRLFPNNRFTREYLMLDWSHDGPREVDWVSGAAFIARGELLDKVGGFDPDYFMFCEDVDICWQAWHLGFKVIYLPTSIITHAIGTSTSKAPNRMIGRFHRSMMRFYSKNMVPQMNPLVRPFALAFAGTSLLLRAGLFMTNNKLDILRRKLGGRKLKGR